MNKEYVYGLLDNGTTVIGTMDGENKFNDVGVISNPAVVQIQTVPVINPLTGQPKPGQFNVGVACIFFPVSWIFRRCVKELCYPGSDDQIVQTYESVLKDQVKTKLKQ